jgi:hypothetical protein
MIIKHIANPKTQSSKASRIGSLVDYITAEGRARDQKAEYIAASGSFYSGSLQAQRAEMIALALEAPRSKDPVDHWLMSWKEGEQPTDVQCKESVDILKRHLGMGNDHLAVYALHGNTKNCHLHIVLNRVDPHSHRVADKGWCIDKAHKAIAEIVQLQGWEQESNTRYIASNNGEVSRVNVARERRPRSKVMDHENATGEKSSERIAIEAAAPILTNALSWEQVHKDLASVGMRYEPKGSGALLWVGQQPVKASVIGRECSRKRMEYRLGIFQPDTNRARTEESPRRPEPLQQDHSGQWAQYRKLLEKHRTEKEAAQTEQRASHRKARESQFALFRKERSELYGRANWTGSALNLARSLMASDHAQRKAQLTEEHKSERDRLRQQLGRRPTFEQFLMEKGKPQLAQAWRYRESFEIAGALAGNGDDSPSKRDIRDFTAQVQLAHDGQSRIHYSRRDAKDISFTDQGKRIDVWKSNDEAAVLAALQLGAQKWGSVTITGPMEFKLLCVELAAKHSIRVTNPELQLVVPQAVSLSAFRPDIMNGMVPPESAYLWHKTDIVNRIHVVNHSQLDWMIAIRMRVTGHDQKAIASALQNQAREGRLEEKRDWANYAERTAQAAFGPRGDREAARHSSREHAWMQIEGREASRENPWKRDRSLPSRRGERKLHERGR